MRIKEKIPFTIAQQLPQLLALMQREEVALLLNPLQEKNGFTPVLALGALRSIQGQYGKAFDTIEEFRKDCGEIFGYFSYDLKNEIEELESNHTDFTGFPNYFFFEPKVIFRIEEHSLNVEYYEEHAWLIQTLLNPILPGKSTAIFDLNARISKEEYISSINQLKQHIHRGDVYEVNFCQEFFAENATINPYRVFEKMLQKSSTPFSSFFKKNELFLLSASPERFLQKEGNRVLSEPIKGTAKRNADVLLDEQNKKDLRTSIKERSENVMIVDLVRNDLSTFASKGSVKVDALFAVHSFPQWHQMISSISCEVEGDISPLKIIKKCFPMGSMTGAPKLRAMQLIEEYEHFQRNVFSGAVGYFKENDFDFNVVIRSIIYNAKKHYVSLSVGSAITANCEAEKEYEECLLKAKMWFEILK